MSSFTINARLTASGLVSALLSRTRRLHRAHSAVGVAFLASACSQGVHFLGFDLATHSSEATSSAESSSVAPIVDAALLDAHAGNVSDEVSSGGTSVGVEAGVDSAADADTAINVVLKDPPNVLVDVLGIDPDRVVSRINNIFEQLFFGDSATESVYVDDPEGAYVFDVLHDDTRMDAMGYAMLILPYFDRQEEFDKLWATVDSKFRYASGARAGYFHHSCATDFSTCSDDVDTFGVFYVVTSLFIAESRWGGGVYARAANEMLVTMRGKEQNGLVEGVMNVFADDGLPRSQPFEGEVEEIFTVSLMPAFFDLWYVHTLDPFWHEAALQSRALLQLVPHPKTGLWPEYVDRSGESAREVREFRSDCYGAGLHMALDHAWLGPHSGYVDSADLLVEFFAPKAPNYPSMWTVEGEALNEAPSGALVSFNGATASMATRNAREALMQAVWEMPVTTGVYRYYDGMSQLLTLLFLSGQLRPN